MWQSAHAFGCKVYRLLAVGVYSDTTVRPVGWQVATFWKACEARNRHYDSGKHIGDLQL